MTGSSPDRRVRSDEEVAAEIRARGLRWALEDGALAARSRHGDFARALAYVNRVGEAAEAANHHPDITISWDTVTLRLVTHSAGGITGADLALATTIDRLEEPDQPR